MRSSTEDIPEDVASAIRRVAAALPGHPHDLIEVRRRGRHRRAVRSAAGALAVAVLAGASIAAPWLLADRAGARLDAAPVSTPATTAPAAVKPPAQRLFLRGLGGLLFALSPSLVTPDPTAPDPGYPPGTAGIVSVNGWQEVSADGALVPLNLAGDVRGFAARPDGRFVTLEWQSLSDKPRRDGPCITDAAEYLRIREPDGTTSFTRDVRVRCQELAIVGATEVEAYLVRQPVDSVNQRPNGPQRLMAHRFSDGQERTVATIEADPSGASIDAGRLIAPSGNDAACRIEIADLASGAVSHHDLAALLPDCAKLLGLRLSPDGRSVAVAYSTASVPPMQARFAIVDLEARNVRLLRTVETVPAPDPHPLKMITTPNALAIAWTDDATVRVAWSLPPAELDHVVSLESTVDVQTYALT
jgi:hypothetical protein